jgi:hypothetical protein
MQLWPAAASTKESATGMLRYDLQHGKVADFVSLSSNWPWWQ